MPTTKEMLLNILENAKINSLPTFQLKCLDMFHTKIKAIPVDEKTEMDLQICGVLLDRCFCDLDKLYRRDQRIISLINKEEVSDQDFFEKVNQILNNEIKKLNIDFSASFFDQTQKNVKTILIDMKGELSQLKTNLDQELEDFSYSEHQQQLI